MDDIAPTDPWVPTRCELCDRPTPNRPGLCLACESTLPFVDVSRHCRYCAAPLRSRPSSGPTTERAHRHEACSICHYERPAIDRLRSLCHYRSPLDMWVPRLKFHGELGLARLLGGLFADRVVFTPGQIPECVIPLPLHNNRLEERGFDQPLEICRSMSDRVNVPLRPELLVRCRATRRQSQMDMEHRQDNLRGAFSVNIADDNVTLPLFVAIFDDVYTTGATINEAAACLLDAGVERVEAWVIAHAD